MAQPVAQLMDDLKNEEASVRKSAVSRLHTIALALGPDRSRTELVPFIACSLLEEEDEVQAALAGQLNGDFLKLLGTNVNENMRLLVPIYESLLSSEESVVRADCVLSIKDVLQQPQEQVQGEMLWAVFEKLGESEEWFTRKSSAASIAPYIYSSLSDVQKQRTCVVFRDSFFSDDNPIVRRAALNAVCQLLKECQVSSREEWLELIGRSADDPQDSVRLLVVEPLTLLGTQAKSLQPKIFPIALKLIGDNSWRVRFMTAKLFALLVEAIKEQLGEFDPIIAFTGLLSDFEAEVRTAAAGQIALVASVCYKLHSTNPLWFRSSLLPVLQKIANDPSPPVRAALALQLNELSAVAGKEDTLQELLPLFLQLFRDDSSQVRLNVLSRLDVINRVIGVEHLTQALVPAIIRLIEDKQWMVRQAIVEYIPVIAEHIGRVFFDLKLKTTAIGCLDDAVYAVRIAAVDMLLRVGQVFGKEYFQELVLALEPFAAHTNYLRRITYLALFMRGSVLFHQLPSPLYTPQLEKLAQDPIPNVRLNVAKLCKAYDLQGIKAQLEQDEDEDVVFYAKQ